MKKIKITFVLFLILFLSLNISLVIASNNANHNLNNYFRIHVVANSDSIKDQILKLNVAQAVDEYISDISKNITDKDEYIYCISNNIYNILEIANKKILESGQDYTVIGYIGKMKYDEKTKDNISQPKGTYNSLKLVIGNGNGENWWSLLFPNSIQGLSTDEVLENDEIIFSFGMFDWFKRLFN